MLNLLSNAVKYTERGSVKLKAAVEDELFVLSVSDTGIGLSEDEKGRLFEEFFRGSRAKGLGEGTGLGLSMAFGAFLAGMMLGETEFRHQVEATIRPFRDVLLGLFFVGVGMLIDPMALPGIWHWVLLGTAVLLLSKILLVAQEALDEGDERDPREVRLFATRAQMQVVSIYARDVVGRGRSTDQVALQAEVHFRRNGHGD